MHVLGRCFNFVKFKKLKLIYTERTLWSHDDGDLEEKVERLQRSIGSDFLDWTLSLS